ncbi:tripartite tricarboxylate transporter permease [Propioniciclava coleopterorum]|uniref:Tripartite tricarboxylate transporter permease n=1 Tax=Propioniciclava coleopterorum TaxID=2714937 RepID=A0A6G7Y9C9_9ACTN|nr:tripartite tricarboxylate transporter permease [Propioniciclava coleopterorum]QIK73415.1 tripartite tricarboxylate transporter permease [Propioniciclava coleopterorum]
MNPSYFLDALGTVFDPINILVLLLSTFIGLVMGMLPGLSATMAIALLTGLTFGLPTQTALISLLAIYVGSISGGAQTAILLNIPGTPASAATAVDGFPLAKQGKAGYAILLATTSSMLGTLISVVFLLTLTPLLSQLALQFGAWEFFLLACFGVAICGMLTSKGNALRGWISGFLGLFVAQIGLDSIDSFPRFSFGNVNLMAGIQLIPVMIGLFGFPEIVKAFRPEEQSIIRVAGIKMGEAMATMRRNWLPVLRSSVIGTGVGIIPGVGEDVGGWLSYAASKSAGKDPDSFGKGNPTGVISAESGNNACIGGAIIPILSLAVPGSAPAAVLLAAFLMHGYRPGPLLAKQAPEFVVQVSIYLAIAALAMWGLALILMRFTVHILRLRKQVLMPIIFVLCAIGSYLINYSLFDVAMMFVFGLIGYFMYEFGFPAAPFLLGVILGPMADSNLRRGLILSDGSLMPMFTRPISLVFIVLIALVLATQLGFFTRRSSSKKAKVS